MLLPSWRGRHRACSASSKQYKGADEKKGEVAFNCLTARHGKSYFVAARKGINTKK